MERNISYDGFNERAITFLHDGMVESGMLVTMDYSGTVRSASEGEAFIGKVVSADSNFAVVQVDGYVECESRQEIGVGRHRLASDGYDDIIESYDGVDVWVITSKETEDGYVIGFLL
jgi:hypothetical protein